MHLDICQCLTNICHFIYIQNWNETKLSQVSIQYIGHQFQKKTNYCESYRIFFKVLYSNVNGIELIRFKEVVVKGITIFFMILLLELIKHSTMSPLQKRCCIFLFCSKHWYCSTNHYIWWKLYLLEIVILFHAEYKILSCTV